MSVGKGVLGRGAAAKFPLLLRALGSLRDTGSHQGGCPSVPTSPATCSPSCPPVPPKPWLPCTPPALPRDSLPAVRDACLSQVGT